MKKLLVILPFKYGGERLQPGDKVEMNEGHARLYKHLDLVLEIPSRPAAVVSPPPAEVVEKAVKATKPARKARKKT